MATVTVRVPATTANLGSGFDALGAALAWHSFVTLSAPHEGIVVEVAGEGADHVPHDERNIAVQAVKALLAHVGAERATPLSSGFVLRLDNRFPLTRGLGSSAAARVGALVAANHLLGVPLTTEELLAIAAQLEGHADNVAAALLGGVVVAVMAKGKVRWARLPLAAEWHLALLIPDFELATEKAREVLPPQVPLQDAVFNVSRVALLVAALATGDIGSLREAMEDRLHQPYRQTLMPWLPRVFEAAKQAGALGVHLSGAGPSVAAWCLDPETATAVAKAMWQSLNAFGLSGSWRIAPLDDEGATVLRDG
jgi:homoserine kinase